MGVRVPAFTVWGAITVLTGCATTHENTAQVDAAYAAAIESGAVDNGAPGARLHYDPDYYAANVLDSDGYSLEFVYKKWQHGQ